MYNRVNPAIIKSILLRLTDKELFQEIEFINAQLEVLPEGNKRAMFERLQSFANNRFRQLRSC